MSDFTEQHDEGVEAFVDELEHTRRTCDECGFEDVILDGEWKTHVERDSHSGHVNYRLECPDCTSEQVVDVNL